MFFISIHSMIELFKDLKVTEEQGSTRWKAPSNIALVKYWGKYADQIPANPSLSFTLSKCNTQTTLNYRLRSKPADDFSIEFYLDDEPKEDFIPKIKTFFERIEAYLPFLKSYDFEIRSTNSFPHSSGIASSASGMAALALCLLEMTVNSIEEVTTEDFYKKASFLARLGSGAGCRSIEGPLVQWCKTPSILYSSDLFGIPYPTEVHPVFENYQDCILIVHKGAKSVSSTLGHQLMENHPYAEQRFAQAHQHIESLIKLFKEGDLKAFVELVELEALSLHAMMLTSNPNFILMKPNTLAIIEKIREFRAKTGIPICFTLDAGANVHVLYPHKDAIAAFDFILSDLVAFCENQQYICDQLGMGAQRLS